MTIFDRYLIRQYLRTFVILFLSAYGLVIVIDGFTNIDSFQEGETNGTLNLLARMGKYYFFQASTFFNLLASILSTVAVMVVLALLRKHSEIYPILAAGIPVYRLVTPLVVGVICLNVLISINQEIIIPRISHQLLAARNEASVEEHKIDPINDYASGIRIGGQGLSVTRGVMLEAQFVLPRPQVAHELTTLTSETASYYEAVGERPAGWLLKNVNRLYEQLPLTEEGVRRVLPVENPQNLFVVTDVSFQDLSNRSQSHQLISTPALIQRIKNPTFSVLSVRSQTVHLHNRLLRPILDVIAVFIAVPLILRRESRSLVMNMASCTAVFLLVMISVQASQYLGSSNLIDLETAAWLPTILSGTLGAWLTGVAQT